MSVLLSLHSLVRHTDLFTEYYCSSRSKGTELQVNEIKDAMKVCCWLPSCMLFQKAALGNPQFKGFAQVKE